MMDTLNPIIDDRLRLIWVIVPKVCSTSIKWLLSGTSAKPGHNIHRLGRFKRISRSEAARRRDYLRFAFVRNPWDRLVSAWSWFGPHSGVRKSLGIPQSVGFTDFVRLLTGRDVNTCNWHFRSQLALLTEDGTLLIDFIGRYGQLRRDWKRLQTIVPGLGDLPHEYKGNHKPYQEYFNDETRRLVGDWYADDVRTFGYTFE